MKDAINGRDPYKVYPKKGEPVVCGVGSEWICPQCGTTFLVRFDKWGYVYKRRKYCSHKCLRAAQNKSK